MYQNNQVDDNTGDWGSPRVKQQDDRFNKNNNNKYSRNNKGSHNGGCCKHILNDDSCNDFSVSSVKYLGTENPGDSQYAEVVFKCKKKRLYKNTNNLSLEPHEYVIAQVENGVDIGTVCSMGKDAEEKYKSSHKDEDPEMIIVRHASNDDLDRLKRNNHDEDTALDKTREMVKSFNLEMKVTAAEWQIDRQRLTIYFTAPQRIDFRELVKELARVFKTRIELRQISTREEAKRIGGMGPCGLDLCCSSFVNEFYHITLDHAKTQQLANNVAKLSGYCGRLKCCLLYEHNTYIEEYKNYPPLNSTVQLSDGTGRLVKIDIFKKQVTLQVNNNGVYRNFSQEEINKYSEDGKVKAPVGEEVLPHLKYDELEELEYFEEDVY